MKQGEIVISSGLDAPALWAGDRPFYVYFDLTKNIKIRLDAEGIAIPFPQRDVHLYQQKEGATQ